MLYDAVALLPSDDGAKKLAKEPAARDFVADAFGHMKVIAHVAAALPLLEKAGVSNSHDDGFIVLKSNDCSAFVEACRKLRCWTRAAGARQRASRVTAKRPEREKAFRPRTVSSPALTLYTALSA